MVLIIKKKVGLFIFLLVNVVPFLYGTKRKDDVYCLNPLDFKIEHIKIEYDCVEVYGNDSGKPIIYNGSFLPRYKGEGDKIPQKGIISWIICLTPFFRDKVIRMVSELLLSKYKDYGDQALKGLKKESEQLKIKNKKLLKKLQCQKDKLRESPEFLKKKHELQLDLNKKLL